ncbi:MAG TPA: ABC transporter permease [Thermoanaerobaculia bacterium]
MFLEVTRTHWTKFRRDRAAFVMTFIVPIVFFSIFAVLFGGRPGSGRIRVAVVNEDGSAVSRQFVETLRREKSVVLVERALDSNGKRTLPMNAAAAEREIRAGDLGLALIIPRGFRTTPLNGTRPRVTLYADTSDPMSSRVISTLMQKAVLGQMPLQVETRDVLGASKRNPRIAFSAAGLGVMFLLFMAASSGGALIDEAENGTLDRILTSRISMTQLLLGKLFYLVSLSTIQLTITFTWGALVFGVELWEHLGGFFLMTVFTAVATSTFGLLLAAICRTRAQLGALSNLVVLVMSALGGSMFPRFMMPEAIQKLGLITLNAWALDGFLKVFWREEPLFALWPQLAVLGTASILLFTTARYLARRWETQ